MIKFERSITNVTRLDTIALRAEKFIYLPFRFSPAQGIRQLRQGKERQHPHRHGGRHPPTHGSALQQEDPRRADRRGRC